jgi:hypothetical protein
MKTGFHFGRMLQAAYIISSVLDTPMKREAMLNVI